MHRIPVAGCIRVVAVLAALAFVGGEAIAHEIRSEESRADAIGASLHAEAGTSAARPVAEAPAHP
jgi:hypothetical protein